VVQQAQGRVKPSRQLKGEGVALNDNARLEREADVMGEKALQRGDEGTLDSKVSDNSWSQKAVMQLKKAVQITSHNIEGETGDRDNTEARMNKVFNGINFKTKYEEVTAGEPGFPKYCCAESNALSKLVKWSKDQNKNKAGLYNELKNAVFGLTEDDSGSYPSKYLNPGNGEDYREFNPQPGRSPERFREHSSSNKIYVDPCGTCCLWMHPMNKRSFRIRNALKNKFI